MPFSLTSLPGRLARHAADLPSLAISTAVRTAGLVGEGAALVRRDGPVSAAKTAAQTAACAALGEARSVVGRLAPGLRAPTRPPASPTTPAPATGRATSPPTPPPPAAREAGAPGIATPAAEAATADLAAAVGTPNGAGLNATELPLADFDHMTLGSLRGRLRTLTVDDLVVLRAYEEKHARRLQVMTMLENRIARLRDQQRDGELDQERGQSPSPT